MTEDCKRHFRTKIRVTLDRLVRKYGCESIDPHVPEADVTMKKCLRNLRKLNARKKRRKDSKNDDEDDDDEWENESFVVKAKPKSIEDILADSDSDLDEMEAKSEKQSKKLKNKKTTDTYIRENADDIVDFTDPSATSKITATRPGAAPTSKQVDEKTDKNRGFKTAGDGRLIIEDLSDSEDDDKRLSDDSESDDDKRSAAETLILGNRKRKRDDADSKISAAPSGQSKYRAGGSGIHRPLSSSAASVHSDAGSTYRSKKAKGDVKKKGQLDPYAYLPLNRSSLNKRKKMKNAGQFKNIVRGAQKGAKKGAKLSKKMKR